MFVEGDVVHRPGIVALDRHLGTPVDGHLYMVV
jgi:hypothetical protein